MNNGVLIFLMAFLFLFLGYLGVPVAFATTEASGAAGGIAAVAR